MSDGRDARAKTAGDGVLSGPLTPSAIDLLCRFADSIGFGVVRVDLAGCDDKAAFLRRMATACGFPGWFGENWDALYDCLADFSWRPAAGYLLLLEHAAGLRDTQPEVFDTALAILDDAATAWRARGVPFRTFVDVPD